MSSNSKSSTVDPDYEITEIVRERVRLKENREGREKAEKAREIINREFQKELNDRQSQLELIQEQINRAQKTLHLLRYVLVSSYYNKQEKYLNDLQETTVSNEQAVSSKSRIHPAIKKLLGNNSSFTFYKTPRKKRKCFDKSKDVTLDETQSTNIAKISDELDTTITQTASVTTNKVNNEQTCDTNIPDCTIQEECITGRNRKKTKHLVVVGNISKWMPSESKEDNSTHKWMVYVRGPKENPDISQFVQKVVFYLHPSYKPNDVVELRDAPFHLARRGWGEFPLRIRIFFRCTLNKPVDIIHNLKLDKTFTGRQTLGSETMVNLFLYNDNAPLMKNSDITKEIVNAAFEVTVKEEYADDINEIECVKEENYIAEDVKDIDIVESSLVPNYEHDYCFFPDKKEIKEEMEDNSLDRVEENQSYEYNVLAEHSYCISKQTDNLGHFQIVQDVESQPTDLIFGIQEEYVKDNIIEETVMEEHKPVLKRKAPGDCFQKVMLSDGTIIAIRKNRRPQQTLLKRMLTKTIEKKLKEEKSLIILNPNKSALPLGRELTENNSLINYNRYKINFPSHKFKNVTEALPYLFKRLSILNKFADDINFKCTYPYTAQSLEEFSKWSIGKRLSSEWYQAKYILKLINSNKIQGCDKWTVKSLIMYARSHGYTPLANYKIFKNKRKITEVVNGTLNNEHNMIKPDLKQTFGKFDELDDIDVVNCVPESVQTLNNSINKTKLIDPKSQDACSYIKQTVLDGGILLKQEEIIPGVLCNAAERILLQAVLCLAEDIIRKARANLVWKHNFHDGASIIKIEEIQKALEERPEFKRFFKTDDTEK